MITDMQLKLNKIKTDMKLNKIKKNPNVKIQNKKNRH